jgi:hypothetical protein
MLGASLLAFSKTKRQKGRNFLRQQILTESVTLRVTPQEKKRLREDAELAGLSLSDLIRRRYFDRPIRASADIAAVKELSRLGGLLKNNFVAMREAKMPPGLIRLQEDVLTAVKDKIEKIGGKQPWS